MSVAVAAAGADPRDDSGDRRRIAVGAVVLVCLSTAPSVAMYRWLTEDPWPYVYVAYGGALLGALLFAVHVAVPVLERPLARSRPLVVAMAAPAALASWALMSSWWTVSPAHTPFQAGLLLMVLATAVWYGWALTFRQQVWALFVGLHALTLLSVIAAIALPSARWWKDGSWMGLFGNPNSAGPVATLGVVAAFGALQVTRDRTSRVLVGGCVAVDVLLAVMASSLTGWLALGAAVAALLAARIVARRGERRLLRPVGTALVVGAVVSIPWTIELAARVAGTTLNARTLIWDFVRDSLDDRWAAGYGWFAFWDDPTRRAPFLERIARERPEWLDDFGALNTAHSTFMEALLALGAVGLVLVLLVVALSMGRAWWAAVDSTGVAMAWWVAVGTFALVENATESMITINPLFWLLLVAPGFAAVRHGESAGFDSPRDSVPAGHRREDSHMQPVGDQSAITA